MKHRKAYNIFLVLLIVALSGCSNKLEEEKSSRQNEEENIPQHDDGYKPVVMYNGSLYWLGERTLTELPNNFVDSQKKVKECLDDPMKLPKEELTTSAKGCDQVGKEIYINEENDREIILSSDFKGFVVFEKNQ